VFTGVDMFYFLFKILAHVLTWMFVLGVAGCCLLVIPIAAYQLFGVLFEKVHRDETTASPPKQAASGPS